MNNFHVLLYNYIGWGNKGCMPLPTRSQRYYDPPLLFTFCAQAQPSGQWHLPCCASIIRVSMIRMSMIRVYSAQNGPALVADMSYPSCRSDGYFQRRQSFAVGHYCVKKDGTRVQGTMRATVSRYVPSPTGQRCVPTVSLRVLIMLYI